MKAMLGLAAAVARLMATRQPPVSQKELSRRMGIGPTTVNKFFTERWNPGAEVLGRVLDALQCDLHDLADALDAVNERGIYAPTMRASGSLTLAEPLPHPYGRIPESGEVVTRLTARLMAALEKIEKLETESVEKGKSSSG